MAETSQKTVFITGASTGIGKAAAELFAAKGWNVVATMRTPDAVEFAPAKGAIHKIRLDVTDQAAIDAAVAEAILRFGRIDALVNNAGYGLIGLFEAMSEAQIRRLIDTNLIGMMALTRAVLPHMRAQKSGRIINVGSVLGRFTLPLHSLYCATKFAVEGFSEALNYELSQHGIRVKVVEPGSIESDFTTRGLEKPANTEVVPAYGDFATRVFDAVQLKLANAASADVAAKSIWRAATDWPGWRIRYKPNGWLLVLGRMIVPGELHVRVVRRVFGAW